MYPFDSVFKISMHSEHSCIWEFIKIMHIQNVFIHPTTKFGKQISIAQFKTICQDQVEKWWGYFKN